MLGVPMAPDGTSREQCSIGCCHFGSQGVIARPGGTIVSTQTQATCAEQEES